MVGRKFFTVLALALSACVARAAESYDWPQWGGPRRDGISRESRWNWNWPKNGPRRLWSQKVGVGWSDVAVAGGRVFTLGNLGDVDHVACLDAATGRVLWDFPYVCLAADPNGYLGPHSTPTVDSGLVFTMSRRGDLVCLRATDGFLVWSRQLVNESRARTPAWGFACSPLVEGNLLIVETGAPGRSVMAFNKFNGAFVWAGGNDTAGYSSPIAITGKESRLIAVFSAHALTAHDARNGRAVWSFPWPTPYDANGATPLLVEDDKLFISSGHGTGCALLRVTDTPPKPVWTHKLMRNHLNSSVLYRGHLYGFDDDKVPQLRCLRVTDGSVRWATAEPGRGALTLAGDKLILFTDAGRLIVAEANPETYQEVAATQVFQRRDRFWTPPVLSWGRLYLRHFDTLVCLDVSAR